MNRREFIKGAASFGFPMIFSGCATAYRANETVQMAAIGCGGRPVADISGLEAAGAKFVGFCDVDLKRSAGMRASHPGVPFYTHYRKMLDALDRDIDAVLIGTPDHWHATMAIECLRRGKHVQCEKPLCQSFHEMDAMLAAAKENPHLVTQAMTQCSLLGVAALFDPNRELQWDFANRRFGNSSAANARLTLPRLQGW